MTHIVHTQATEVLAQDIDTVVGFAERAASAYPRPGALYSFASAWQPAVDAAIAAKRLTPCIGAVGGVMGLIGYWIPEALAERLDHEIYEALKGHRFGNYRTEQGWGRHLDNAVELACELIDTAIRYG